MRSKLSRLLVLMVAAITMMSAFSVSAYAQVPDSVNESADAAPQEETEKEDETKDEKKEEKTAPLTPDGNLTLVDDIKTTSDGDKEFLTVVSKNGNYFYIIVDRADNGENNVHFLNLVDERDLEDLIDGELSINKEPEPVITTPEPVITTAEPEPEPTEEPKKGLSGGAIFGAIILLLALAGGGFYYIKFVKPKNDPGNPDDLEIMEWDDDEDEDDDPILEEEEPEVEPEEESAEQEKPEESQEPKPFQKKQEKIKKAYAEKVSVIDGKEMTREEIIDELFGGDDE